MSTAMQALEPKAFHYEARAYCEKFDIPMEEYESVRCRMAQIALHQRMEPYMAALVRLHPAMYSLNSDALSPEYVRLQKQVDEIRQQLMEDLGLTTKPA